MGVPHSHPNHPHGHPHPHAKPAPFEQLPQTTGQGFYRYSTGDRQWGTHDTIQTLLDLARQQLWNLPGLPIEIGDISFQDGRHMPPHTAPLHGRNVDIRPFRKDKALLHVTIHDAQYDRAMTELLVQNLLAHRNVHRILFNDKTIKGVHYFHGHDNHLHVETKS
jgi:penicillin-insensitive murein DD-endopeptidase